MPEQLYLSPYSCFLQPQLFPRVWRDKPSSPGSCGSSACPSVLHVEIRNARQPTPELGLNESPGLLGLSFPV